MVAASDFFLGKSTAYGFRARPHIFDMGYFDPRRPGIEYGNDVWGAVQWATTAFQNPVAGFASIASPMASTQLQQGVRAMSWNWEMGAPDDTTGSTDVGGPTSTDTGVVGDTGLSSDWGYDFALPTIPVSYPGAVGAVGGAVGRPVVTTPTMGAVGGAAMAVGGAVGRFLPAMVVAAITKLSRVLGGASGSVASYGARVWANLSGWAAKNPGVSLVTTLVSLGLTVEEAAHFIAWGASRRRKRRARGVSGRDLKTTRRTMRKLNSYVAQLRHLCSPVSYHRRHYAAHDRASSFRRR